MENKKEIDTLNHTIVSTVFNDKYRYVYILSRSIFPERVQGFSQLQDGWRNDTGTHE